MDTLYLQSLIFGSISYYYGSILGYWFQTFWYFKDKLHSQKAYIFSKQIDVVYWKLGNNNQGGNIILMFKITLLVTDVALLNWKHAKRQ